MVRWDADIRFKSDHIAQELSFIPLVIAYFSCPVHHLHTGHPLVHGHFILAREIVSVPDQTGHDTAKSRGHVRAHGIDDIVGEVGVEAMRGHCSGVSVLRGVL